MSSRSATAWWHGHEARYVWYGLRSDLLRTRNARHFRWDRDLASCYGSDRGRNGRGGIRGGREAMIVIDVGCARYGGDYSIERLIEEFHPDLLYGFDPNPVTTQKPPGECDAYVIEGTTVFIERLAAWTYRGQIGYLEDGLNSCL